MYAPRYMGTFILRNVHSGIGRCALKSSNRRAGHTKRQHGPLLHTMHYLCTQSLTLQGDISSIDSQVHNLNRAYALNNEPSTRKKRGEGSSAAVKRGPAFLSATELIRSLSFNSKWKFGVRGRDDVGLIQSTKAPPKIPHPISA